jgi:hypothetical protein
MLTIYKSSKLILFTNFWKNFVYLFAKSEFAIGQFPPAFVILFLRTCLCFFNSSHSHNKWSVVCGLILQRHVGSSMILNLWRYDLSLPCPVTIVDQIMHICSLFYILSFTLGKKVFVKAPLFVQVLSHSLCHFCSPKHFSSLVTALLRYYGRLFVGCCRRCVCVSVSVCVYVCVCVCVYVCEWVSWSRASDRCSPLISIHNGAIWWR